MKQRFTTLQLNSVAVHHAPSIQACARALPRTSTQVAAEKLPVQKAAQMLGEEFHLPGHIFLCQVRHFTLEWLHHCIAGHN